MNIKLSFFIFLLLYLFLLHTLIHSQGQNIKMKHPSTWKKTDIQSYISPQFEDVKTHNENMLDHIIGFHENYRKVKELRTGYHNMFKWVDGVIAFAHPSIDEYSISAENTTLIYWGWGEDHINHAKREGPAVAPCENYTNVYKKTAMSTRWFDGEMTFEYYNLSKTVPITFFYEVMVYCPDPDRADRCKYLIDNELVWDGSYEGFYEKYIIPNISGKIDYLNNTQVEQFLRGGPIHRDSFEESPPGCEPPHCHIRWYYYYLNPVPVPYNESQYVKLFNIYNNRTYIKEPWLNITLHGRVKLRITKSRVEYVYHILHHSCERHSKLEYSWESRSVTDKKSYFVELGNVEWFHITPVLGEEINNKPEVEFVTFANRRMQRGYSLIDGKLLTNYYMKRFDVFEDSFGLWHVGTTKVNRVDFTPSEEDPFVPNDLQIPHHTIINHTEKLCAPYQITRSNHSFRWVNYYLINFTEEDGKHNFTHVFYDVFGNNFTLSRDIYLRLPTWISGGVVYSYKKGLIGTPNYKEDGLFRIYYFNGTETYRPSVALSPYITMESIGTLIGLLVGGMIVLSVIKLFW